MDSVNIREKNKLINKKYQSKYKCQNSKKGNDIGSSIYYVFRDNQKQHYEFTI